MYALGRIGGFLHLYIGQEAVAVGATSTVRLDDYAVSSYREHGHCLAKGSDPRRIVGAHLPLAAGAAFAIKYQGGDQVVLCYFGDGAVPEGEFHESMNLAALWKLPVIFICENNRYAMGTAIHRALAQTDIWRFAETYGIPGEAVDGMDVLAVRDVVARAVERARRDKTPALIDARTYRFRGHSMRDPAGSVYRTKEEVEREKLRDPITLFSERCLKEGVLADTDLKNVEKAVNDLADEAVAFAEASPEPPPEDLFRDVYKD